MLLPRSYVALALLLVGCNGCQKSATSSQGLAALDAKVGSKTPALKPGEFAPGPPFGDLWCLSAEQAVPEEVVRKHIPPNADKASIVPGASPEWQSPVPACSRGFSASHGEKVIDWVVRCGDVHMGRRPWSKPFRWEEAGLDKSLGKDIYSYRERGNEQITAWDNDTPCNVQTFSRGYDDSARRAQALMVDLLKALTPERIGAPRAEYVVAAEDDTGERAKAELSRWAQKRATLSKFTALPSSYPQVIDSDDYPGLPPGRHFLLLAVCKAGRGETLTDVWKSVLIPDGTERWAKVQAFSVPGEGLVEACPPNLTGTPTSTQGGNSSSWSLDDGRRIAIAYVNSLNASEPGEIYSRAGAFLFDEDENVIDSVAFSEKVPPPTQGRGKYSSQATNTFGVCDGKMWLDDPNPSMGFFCESLWDDEKCSQPGYRKVNYVFRVEGNKLAYDTKVATRRGEGCFPNVAEE